MAIVKVSHIEKWSKLHLNGEVIIPRLGSPNLRVTSQLAQMDDNLLTVMVHSFFSSNFHPLHFCKGRGKGVCLQTHFYFKEHGKGEIEVLFWLNRTEAFFSFMRYSNCKHVTLSVPRGVSEGRGGGAHIRGLALSHSSVATRSTILQEQKYHL